MYKTKLNLIAVGSLFALLCVLMLGCKKHHDEPPATQNSLLPKDILTFEFLKKDNSGLPADYNSSVNGTTITATLPSSANLAALKAAFTISQNAVALVNGQVQNTQVSVNDFRQPVIYTIKAVDGSTKNYTVTITTK